MEHPPPLRSLGRLAPIAHGTCNSAILSIWCLEKILLHCYRGGPVASIILFFTKLHRSGLNFKECQILKPLDPKAIKRKILENTVLLYCSMRAVSLRICQMF